MLLHICQDDFLSTGRRGRGRRGKKSKFYEVVERLVPLHTIGRNGKYTALWEIVWSFYWSVWPNEIIILNQITSKQHNSISPSSRGWEVQGGDVGGGFRAWRGLLSWYTISCVFMSSHDGSKEGALWGL